MKVFFDSKEAIRIAFDPFKSKTVQKQDVADFLMSNGDEESDSLISERMLLMAYLPFIRTVAVETRYLSREGLKENQIELIFENSTLVNPSNVILEVSPALYKFLSVK